MNIWISRIWQCLLRVYSPEFHYEFGPEMTQAFEERTRKSTAHRAFGCSWLRQQTSSSRPLRSIIT